MKKIKVSRLYPVALFFLIPLFFWIRGKLNDNKFFPQKINSKIISRNNWQIRTTEFTMDNGLRIDSSIINEVDLQIGDSITKEANSWYFIVFKKDFDGKYKLSKSYIFEH